MLFRSPGVSEALVGQVDLLASLAALTGQSVDTKSAPDSQNVLPALLGQSKAGRETLVEHSGTVTLRQGSWKYIKQGNHLYDLATDPHEDNDLAAKFPERATAMAATLEKIREAGTIAR